MTLEQGLRGEEVSHLELKSVPGTGTSWCKDLEVGMCLVCSKNSKEASTAEWE